MTRPLLVLCFCLFAPALSFTAPINAEQAYEIALANAIAQDPALDSEDTVVRKKHSDKSLVFTVSDPYYMNGQKFWRTYRHYEYSAKPVNKFTKIGAQLISPSANAPLPAKVPTSLNDKVMEWLSFWDSQSSLDPELRIGAGKTEVHLFLFEQGTWGPYATVGVDGDGNTFKPSVDSPLFPWRGRLRVKRAKFQEIYR